MAVTFVVETGTGLSNATSYVSEADADQIVEDYGLSWPGSITSDEKEQSLNVGTRYLDRKYDGAWKGYKGSNAQALAWPRNDVVDTDGWTIDSNVIPTQLKQATVEVAVYFADSGAAFPDLDNPGSLQAEKIKIDVIEIEKRYLAGNAGSEIAEKVDAILAGFLQGTGANAEVRRG